MSKQTDLINIPDAITVSGSNVGIGESNPDAKLHIRDATDGGSSSTTSAIQFSRRSGGANDASIKIQHDGSDGVSNLQFHFGTSEALRINSSGVVTIGNAAAASYGGGLVVADLTGSYITVADNGSGERLHLEGGSGSTTVGSKSNHDLRIITNDAEVARFDTSGNLLVGTTDPLVADSTNGGIVLGGQRDLLHVSRVNQPPVKFSRANNDGDIAVFAKNGTTVGSIGTAGSDLTIGTGDVALRFQDGSDNLIPHNVATNSTRDAGINIGTSGARFKDLHLSGGVYLGGTGSANKLEDYEEGTYTVTATPETTGTQTLSSTHRILNYTKIGRVVKVNGNIYISSNSGAAGSTIFNLPFASSSAIKDQSFSVLGVGSYPVGTSTSLMSAGSNMRAYKSDNGPLSAPQWYSIDFTYITDA